MAKITVQKESNYTVIDNGIFKDKNLSLKARGLLATMLSLPEEWDYTVEGLSVILKEGQSSIKSILRELEECGYLVRTQKRSGNKCFGKMDYTIYEKPINKGFEPSVENPPADSPTAGNRRQLNKKELSTDKSSKHLNGLHSAELINHSAQDAKELDFAIVERQIKKVINSLGYGNDKELISCTTEVFRYYYWKYYSCLGCEHPILSAKAMTNAVNAYIDGSELTEGLCYDTDAYFEMINRHFKKDYTKDTDYSICHFFTEGIQNYLFYECCY